MEETPKVNAIDYWWKRAKKAEALIEAIKKDDTGDYDFIMFMIKQYEEEK